MRIHPLISALFLCSTMRACAFVPNTRATNHWGVQPTKKHIPMHPASLPTHILHQRKSVAAVQTCGGLFGLGPAEIAIIFVAGAFVLGPQKLGELLKSSGKMVMEFKEELNDVPEEFKKGLEEGEVNARSRKAKEMKKAEKEQ